MASIEVYVAAHKPIDFALPDYCRKIQVNAESTGQWEGYLHDNDSPDNISLKNPDYCELTALYSMWRNCKADIQGLFHYRRFISRMDKPELEPYIILMSGDVKRHSITEANIIDAFRGSDIILCFPYYPYPANALEALKNFVYQDGIRTMCEVLLEYHPDYKASLDYVLASQHISYCNMFIARREFVDEYCRWLFELLYETERRINNSGYDASNKRIYGYFSEVLLNVYIHRHNLRPKYFMMILLHQKRVLRYKLHRVKMMLKKIPGFMKLMYSLHLVDEVVARRYASMKKFLSRLSSQTGNYR